MHTASPHSSLWRPGILVCLALALGLGGAARADQILNGDFTQDLTDWTLSGNVSDVLVESWYSGMGTVLGAPGSPDIAYIGPDAPALYLSQTVDTIVGQVYDFSFEVAHTAYDGDLGAEFTASFGSDEVFDAVGGPDPNASETSIYGQWRTETFTVVATAPTTTITFSFISPPGYYLLTDVDPEPPPPPASLPDGGVGFGVCAVVLLGLCLFPAYPFRHRLRLVRI